jgi:Zn-dependent peptidase ImmA (M78 family)
MSQLSLANKTGLTQGYLSKIENGLTEPSEDVVEKFRDVLNYPNGFFYQSDHVYGLPVSVHPMYRKKTSVGQRAIEQIHAGINIRLLHLKRLFQSIEFSNNFPLPEFDIDEYDGDIERISGLLRRTWLIPDGPIDNLTYYLEQAGILIIICDFNNIAIDGISLVIPGLPPSIFLNQNQPGDRMRLTLAHELGHIVMHRIPVTDMESQAYDFASSFLMPRKDILKSFRGKITLPRLAALKPVWKISIQALLMRAKSVESITYNQSRYLWMQINKYKIKFREPPELDIPKEEPSILHDVFKTHLNELGYSLEEIAQALYINKSELCQMYQLSNSSFPTRPKLRLVS